MICYDFHVVQRIAIHFHKSLNVFIADTGVEPAITSLWGWYEFRFTHLRKLPVGIEPTTYRLQIYRSASWTKVAYYIFRGVQGSNLRPSG